MDRVISKKNLATATFLYFLFSYPADSPQRSSCLIVIAFMRLTRQVMHTLFTIYEQTRFCAILLNKHILNIYSAPGLVLRLHMNATDLNTL